MQSASPSMRRGRLTVGTDPTRVTIQRQPWQQTLDLRRTLHHPSIPHQWTSRCPYDACGDLPWCAMCMTHKTRRDEEAHRGD